jgi:PucR C-terminal helix-turn-helix domain/GGDEF-like domain
MSARQQKAATPIVRTLRSDMSGLLDKVVERIRAEIPFYAADDVVSADDLRTSVADNVDWILDNLTGDSPVDMRAPEGTGRARAVQGAPLVEVLTAYRVGFAELWSALVATARAIRGISDDVVVDLAGVVFALQNAYSDALISAYRDEAQQLLRAQERERAVLLEAILSGAATKGALWEVADALRLPLDGAFLVVAAETELGHDPLPRVESALAVLDVRSVWRLEADYSLGVLSLPDRARVDVVLHRLDRHATGRIGVSPIFAELRQAAWALRLARLALGSRPGGAGVEQFRDSPLGVLVAAAPHAALETARAVLGDVLELPPEDRDLLLRTFEAWVEARGSANAASALLFCHPNTVRYRLRRIESSTGRTLSNPADVAELVTAAHAWSQLPHPA